MSDERNKLYDFNNESFFNNWGVIYVRPGIVIERLEDLKGRTVAVMKDSIHYTGKEGIRNLLSRLKIECNYVEAQNYEDVFQFVKNKKADCGVVNRLFGNLYYVKYGLEATSIIFNPVDLKVALPKNADKNVDLIKIIDDELKKYKQDRNSIYYILVERYLLDKSGFFLSKVTLSDTQKKWIKEHPVIRLGIDPEFAPYEYYSDDGEFMGISSDYVSYLNKTIGLNIEVVYGLTWNEVMEGIENRKLDILSAVGITGKRDEFLVFSDPYISYYRVIITKSDAPFIADINELNDMKVGVQRNTSNEGFILQSTDITPVLFDSLKDTLFAISNGKIDAAIGNVAASSYWIKKMNLTNLKISAPASQEIQSLHFAVRKDWPELREIINKGLSSMIEKDRINIRQKWINIDYKPGIDIGKYKWYIIIVSVMVVMIFSTILIWNYKLNGEIGKRKIIEQRLHEAMEAASLANNAKSRFLANMSHEIRTPMNAVLGYAQILLKEKTLGEIQRKNVDSIYRNGIHLLNLINNVLNMSKIESGKITLDETVFDLDELLEEIRIIFDIQVRTRNLYFNSIKHDGLPRYITGDRNKIKQVLINLVGNAVKNTDSGGINFETAVAGDINDMHNEFEIRFTVKDTGRGISTGDLEEIFNPFVQSTDQKLAEGTGLGLSISKSFARLMRGDIVAESSKGKGSTFTFTAMITKGSSFEIEKKNGTSGILQLNTDHEIRVLVVDDRESNRDILTQMLLHAGFTVKEAVNGVEALTLFEKFEPHIILLDVVMPEMDGVEVTRRIRSSHKGMNAVIIAVTASAMDDDIKEVVDAGVDDIIRKPFIDTELFESIKKHARLDYIYEQKSEDNEMKTFDFENIEKAAKAVPLGLINELEQAINIGYMAGLRDVIKKISKINIDLADVLNDLADDYGYDEIKMIFKL